jgi:2,3-bisphosphoglycerate-dependent phosphoglycerate mutase
MTSDVQRQGASKEAVLGDRPTSSGQAGRRVAAFMRHGHFDRPEQVASAHLPNPLSDRGRQEARAAAPVLLAYCEDLGLELDTRIESSSLLRAWQTASELASALEAETGLAYEVEPRDELMERGIGSCANLRFDEIEALLGRDPRVGPLPEDWRRVPDFRLPVPGAESLLEAGTRTAARIEASLDLLPDDGVDRLRLFVAHGGCLRHAAVALGLLDVDIVRQLTMGYAHAVLFERIDSRRWAKVAGEWKKRLSEPPRSGGTGPETESPPAPHPEEEDL